MQSDDHGVEDSSTARPGRRDSDVSALTGIGLLLLLASLVVARFSGGELLAMLARLASLVPFGAAVVVGIRRRVGGATVLPVVLFVLTAVLGVVRLT